MLRWSLMWCEWCVMWVMRDVSDAWCEWCVMWDVSDVSDVWCEWCEWREWREWSAWCDMWVMWVASYDVWCEMWVMWWYLVVLKRRNPEVSKLNFLWSWIMDPSFSKMVTSTVSGNLNYDDFSISTVYSLSEQLCLQVFPGRIIWMFLFSLTNCDLSWIFWWFVISSFIQLHEAPTAATVDSIPILAHQTRGKLQRNFTEKKKRDMLCHKYLWQMLCHNLWQRNLEDTRRTPGQKSEAKISKNKLY